MKKKSVYCMAKFSLCDEINSHELSGCICPLYGIFTVVLSQQPCTERSQCQICKATNNYHAQCVNGKCDCQIREYKFCQISNFIFFFKFETCLKSMYSSNYFSTLNHKSKKQHLVSRGFRCYYFGIVNVV